MRVALYVRTARKDEPDKATITQEESMIEYAQEHGYTIVGTYRDVSLAPAERPGLRDMMHAASQGLFDAVLVQGFDRVSRKQNEVAALRERLRRECGVDVINISEAICIT